MQSQQQKAQALHHLHHNGEMLILPNIWDVAGAAMLQDVGYPAVTTASASIAYTNGYHDGENIPFGDFTALLTRIVAGVSIPVTADIESGFAKDTAELAQNIRRLIDTGIAGINLEDTDRQTGQLFSIAKQCERLQIVRKTADEMGVPLFINARTDVFSNATLETVEDNKLKEVLKRGQAYMAAGANCFYPIMVTKRRHIAQLVDALKCPINIYIMPGVPGLKALRDLGVARVSTGPGFLKVALQQMMAIAIQLKNDEGMDDVTGSTITSGYLKKLVHVK